MKYLLGIDGGGTSCRAALADWGGNIIGRGKSGASNIMTNLDQACTHILEAAEQAFDDAGVAHEKMAATSALLGVAGANFGEYNQQLEARLPFARSIIESDAVIALYGALGPHDGTIGIVGTGSVFASRHGSYVRMLGGWGFVLGDLGGGARLGQALLQEALLAFDGIHESSELTRKVMSLFEGDPRALVEYAKSATPADFAALAPLVFEQARHSDEVARRLAASAVRSVEEAFDAIMAQSATDRLCLVGGLAHFYVPLLAQRFRDVLHAPIGDGLSGAVALAAHHFAHVQQQRHG